MIRLLITGTGRCGTMYMARLLTASGVPCGHEDVYTVAGIMARPDLEADSSWAAAPWLTGFSGTVIHLVRHPMEVVRSHVGARLFGPKRVRPPFYGYAKRWCKRTGDEVRDSMRWVLLWNEMIETHADQRIRVEDQPDAAFLESIGATAEPSVPTDINHRDRQRDVPSLPRGDLRDRLAAMAERYGYSL